MLFLDKIQESRLHSIWGIRPGFCHWPLAHPHWSPVAYWTLHSGWCLPCVPAQLPHRFHHLKKLGKDYDLEIVWKDAICIKTLSSVTVCPSESVIFWYPFQNSISKMKVPQNFIMNLSSFYIIVGSNIQGFSVPVMRRSSSGFLCSGNLLFLFLNFNFESCSSTFCSWFYNFISSGYECSAVPSLSTYLPTWFWRRVSHEMLIGDYNSVACHSDNYCVETFSLEMK